jgi:hypothetical protein
MIPYWYNGPWAKIHEISLGVAQRGVNCRIYFGFGRAEPHSQGSAAVTADCSGTSFVSVAIAFAKGYLKMWSKAMREFKDSKRDLS